MENNEDKDLEPPLICSEKIRHVRVLSRMLWPKNPDADTLPIRKKTDLPQQLRKGEGRIKIFLKKTLHRAVNLYNQVRRILFWIPGINLSP